MNINESVKRPLRFTNRHKTKITGALLVIIGSLQANATFMQELLSPRAYAMFTIAAGMFVALLGFLNAPKESE